MSLDPKNPFTSSTPPAQAPAQQAVKDYTIDSTEDVAGDIFKNLNSDDGDGEPKPEPEPKKDENQPDQTNTPALPGDDDEGDDPFGAIDTTTPKPKVETPVVEPPTDNKGLREQLRLANEKSERLEREAQERAQQQQERDQPQSRYSTNPELHPDVQSIFASANHHVQQTARGISLSGEDGKAVLGIVQKYAPALAKLDPNSDEYANKIKEIRSSLSGDYSRENISAIVNTIDHGISASREGARKMNEVRENAVGLEYKEAITEFNGIVQKWNEKEQKAFAFTEDQEANDPFAVNVLLNTLSKDDPKVGTAMKAALRTAKAYVLPLAPIGSDELANKSPEEISHYLDQREAAKTGITERIHQNLPAMIVAYRLFPGIVRQLKAISDAASDSRSMTPSPAGSADPRGEKKVGSISDYDPGDPQIKL